MNDQNIRLLYNVICSKFETVEDFRKFLVKNFEIDDVKHETDNEKFSDVNISFSGNNCYIMTNDRKLVLSHFKGLTSVQCFYNFVDMKRLKTLLFEDLV